MAIKLLQNSFVKHDVFLLNSKQDYINITGAEIKELYLNKEKDLNKLLIKHTVFIYEW